MPFEYFLLPGILAFIIGIYKGKKSVGGRGAGQ